MLGWLFKKKDKAQAAAPAVAKKGTTPPAAPPAPRVDWAGQLAQARGNDDALLALARQAGAPLQLKQDAVEALAGEAALKVAELEFRNHDRRVHQLAKRRLAACVAQRQAREQAARLIDTARSLAGEANTPVSRGVELDQAWQALDASLLAPEQLQAFAALSAQLTAQVRQRTEFDQQRKRWVADAGLAVQQVQAASTEAAAGRVARADLATALAAGQAVLAALPPPSAVDKTDQAANAAQARLHQALQTAAALDQHLAVLNRLLAMPLPQPAQGPAPVSPAVDAGAAGAADADADADADANANANANDSSVAAAEAEADDPAGTAAAAAGAPVPGSEPAADNAAAPQATATTPAPMPPSTLPPAAATAATAAADTATDAATTTAIDDPLQAWHALAPLPDAPLAAMLAARLAGWQLARDQDRLAKQAQRRVQTVDRQHTRQSQQGAALAETLVLAEAALDAGHLADAQRYQAHIDKALQGGEPPEALRARVAAAQGRLAELRGWQHWAGARARDELVLQAEALAAATLGAAGRADAVVGARTDGARIDGARPDGDRPVSASTDGAGTGGAGSDSNLSSTASTASDAIASNASSSDNPGSVTPGSQAQAADPASAAGAASPATAEGGEAADAVALAAEVARLSVRQRVDVIDTLRARWKEMDRQGGGGGQALWPRFDAAVKAAYAPVAAHMAAQRAVREANLLARQHLLDALEAVGAPPMATATAAVPAEPGLPDATAPIADEPAAVAPAADQRATARAMASALDRFQAEWRKLGPLEHTVPREARTPLAKRLAAAVQRAEATVQAARGQARSERLALVARAQALAAEGTGRGRDLVADARALQAEWQQHAKGMPLSRGDEQALWTDFKTAVDAAFAAREAGFSARDAEFEAHAAERHALIARLHLQPDDSAATQRRTLAEVDAAWRQCGPAPRARAAALDADYQAARAALLQWLDQAAQRAWQATCDALDAKLAWCAAREAGAPQGELAQGQTEADAAAWQALPALPPLLEAALRQRAGLQPAPARPATPPPPATDELLLQIESDWQLPSPPAFEAARRAHKLMAMKAALEGRRAGAPEVWPAEAALAQLLGSTGLDATQQARLGAVLAAWRQRGPQRPA